MLKARPVERGARRGCFSLSTEAPSPLVPGFPNPFISGFEDLVHLSIFRQSHCSTVPGMFLKPGWRLFIFGLSPVLAIWSGVPSEPQRSNFFRTIDNPRLALSPSQLTNTVGAKPIPLRMALGPLQ